MTAEPSYLRSNSSRSRMMRLGTAQLLKRFFFCERAAIVHVAHWLPSIASFDIKTQLPCLLWQNAETAHALRNRILELRYPNRLIEEEGADGPLVELFRLLSSAPSELSVLLTLRDVVYPALREAYQLYLEQSDIIADGPTHRFLSQALVDKQQQIDMLKDWTAEQSTFPDADWPVANDWSAKFADCLARLGGIHATEQPSSESPTLPDSKPFEIPAQPARDSRFVASRFYSFDNVDRSHPYGEGVALQLRVALSHLNEVWAVENAGVLLSAFADQLPWEWVRDAARWTYDESRHCRMGYERLISWGFDPSELPLATYIYESGAKEDPIYKLGMLFYFETKNIGFKVDRIQQFQLCADEASEHDMDFDWADETIHATYGKKWIQEILRVRGESPERIASIRDHCSELVERYVATCTTEEREQLRAMSERLLARAKELVARDQPETLHRRLDPSDLASPKKVATDKELAVRFPVMNDAR